MNFILHLAKIGAAIALISERPYKNTWMILISLKHTVGSVDYIVCKLWSIARNSIAVIL